MLGEEARKYGLKYSLLERLQQLYTEYGECASKHMVSLNTNYRCHQGIMKIPNELFYASQIKSSPHTSHPHPRAEFPLLFVCSSLTNEVDNSIEAELLLDYTMHFVGERHWPEQWGLRDISKICLTTASRTQVKIYYIYTGGKYI